MTRSDPWHALKHADERASAALLESQRLRDQHYASQKVHTSACATFYDSSAPNSMLGVTFFGQHMPGMAEGGSAYNVIQAVIDTFTSHIVKERIRPMFLTSKGSWQERRDAEAMGLGVEAALMDAGLYGDEGTLVARDGCIVGTGCVKWIPDYANHRLLIERCVREELLIDQRDGRLGKPRQVCHLQRIDRGVLRARFPEYATEIDNAPAAQQDIEDAVEYSMGVPLVSDQVEVAELWHLPSGYVDATKDESWSKKAKHDGRHVLVLPCAENVAGPTLLLDEAWPLEVFPFAFFRPKRRPIGFDGRGFVETLKDAQLQINRMLKRVDGIMALHSKMTLYLNRQAAINPGRITNDWSTILEGDGPAEQAIRYISPQAVSGDYITQIERLIAWSFQEVGLSELSVTAEKPPGMESGVALRTLLDTESIRHTDVFRAWESFFLELSRGIVEGLRMLARGDDKFTLVWGDDHEMKEIKWSLVDLENSKWRLRTWPINLLPSTPSAKLERVQELYKEKAITREQMMMALDYPDMKALGGDKTAAQRNVERMLAQVQEGGDPALYTPHGFLLLDLAKSMGVERYNALEADGAPPDILARVQRWIEDVDALLERAQLVAISGSGGAQQAPPGPPGLNAGAEAGPPEELLKQMVAAGVAPGSVPSPPNTPGSGAPPLPLAPGPEAGPA